MSPDFLQSLAASSLALLALMVIMGVIYTIWSQINMRKKRNYFKELHTELTPGKEVMFAGGIFGTVQSVGQDRVTVKVRSGATLDVSRYAVQEIEK